MRYPLLRLLFLAAAALAASVTPVAAAAAASPRLKVSGWLPTTWDYENSLKSLVENAEIISAVSPVWYWARADGSVVARLPQRKSGPDPGPCEPEIKAVCAKYGIALLPLISNSVPGKGFDADMISGIVNSDTVRTEHVRTLTGLVVGRGYDGIEIDYECLHGRERDAFTRFMTELATSLHAKRKILAIAVHPKLAEPGDDWGPMAHDYAALGAVVDRFRVMAYDHHWATGPAGPVASLSWFTSVLEFTVARVPKEKIEMGIPTYGYDWTGSKTGKSADVDARDAADMAKRLRVLVLRDPESGSPHFSYLKNTDEHQVWYEDAGCLPAKLAAVRKAGAAGIAVWRLGSEEPEFWKLLAEARRDRRR
jgi:spore germination protein YaaH